MLKNIRKLFVYVKPLLNDYIKDNGLQEVKLGADDKKAVSNEANQEFLQKIGESTYINNVMIIVMMVLFCIVFILELIFVFIYSDSPTRLTAIFSVAFASFFVVIKGLQQLWREKSAMDMLQRILPNLPPEEVVKIVEILFYSGKVTKQKSSS